jgi:hypothetical protein
LLRIHAISALFLTPVLAEIEAFLEMGASRVSYLFGAAAAWHLVEAAETIGASASVFKE